MITYVTSESYVRPEPIQIFPTTVYIRKDITQKTRENEDGTTDTYYEYQEAAILTEDFNKQAGTLLLMMQKDAENDRLILMEAFADLYETMATNIV